MSAQMDNNTLDQQSLNHYDDEEIDLLRVFKVLWEEKFKIISGTSIFAIASIIYALSIPDQYKAIAVLAPAQQEGSSVKAMGKLGSIASLAGVNLNGGGASDAEIAKNIMLSWSFIDRFISVNGYEFKLFAAEGWDRASNEVIFDSNIYDIQKGAWMEGSFDGSPSSPTSWQLFEEFSGRITVIEDKKTKLTSISFEHYSPYIAKEWLDTYISSINKHMQDRKVKRVTNNITYLTEQIEKTSIAEMREVFYTIIEEQIKNKMLAEASPDYAFLTVSPSMVPEQKSQPQRAVICIFGTLLGGMLSVLLVLARRYARKSD